MMTPLLDPRRGDIGDDASSTKARSLLAIAGTLLAEVSIPKLTVAFTLLVLVPGVVLGLVPLVASAWIGMLPRTTYDLFVGIWSFLLVLAILAAGWIGGRPALRAGERNFWALNALAVQPLYALCREGLRHLMDFHVSQTAEAARRARLRAAASLAAGVIACGIALLAVAFAWPHTRWIGQAADIVAPHRLVVPALANAVVLMGAYLAGAALAWGLADASMDQAFDLVAFDPPPPGGRQWRIAHLSDLHVVGERYGFRIESGRAGPRGNDRLERAMSRLAEVHAVAPLDLVLVTGDMTDSGRPAEWAEFLDIVARYPLLAKRMLILPGNHDVNVVDKANPARLDLPGSPGKRLRQMRALSAIAEVQGERVRLVDPATGRLGKTLSEALAPHRQEIVAFADAGGLRHAIRLRRVWDAAFPMVLPPEAEDGLGTLLLNSNAETHFSFTNALGLIPVEQARAVAAVIHQFPRACWIVALHHHLVEYPKPAKAFSERIGTALINGTWFVRQFRPLGRRVVAMHGHRHIDWIGGCGDLRIISAPSPVMGAVGDAESHFHVHSFAAGADGLLCLSAAERITIPGAPAAR
ncbi:metallophosphoesterase family protein [Limobrevibacterium gyesilva]|uniref:Metallophosphoesterase n=1 Tax=Limobrevibacterium gyesilva TaxID=2991712 RepID=A0AA41YIA4_9PROT|nr:metallophosphoesterase [Limobrevibacterium gyesilva]MCW3473484.1 metallophosphoesterase [Limobrevibacterium gyesilva]